jgi:integrase
LLEASRPQFAAVLSFLMNRKIKNSFPAQDEIGAGVHIENGKRFGLHNFRHSLSNWLVKKAKVEPKTVQGILRHGKIQTTLDLYTQEDSDETRAAQGEFLNAVGMNVTVQ